MDQIPRPSIRRLCRVYGLLDDLVKKKIHHISSGEIGDWIGVPSHTVRKDISYLGELGPSPRGYRIERLRSLIQAKMHLGVRMSVCIVGLTDLGASLLSSPYLFSDFYPVRAGFDGNINRLEILRTQIPLYPVRDIAEVVKRKGIKIAVLTAMECWLENAVDRLLQAGIQGIITFSPVEFQIQQDNIWVIRLDLKNELRILSTLISLSDGGGSFGSTANPLQE